MIKCKLVKLPSSKYYTALELIYLTCRSVRMVYRYIHKYIHLQGVNKLEIRDSVYPREASQDRRERGRTSNSLHLIPNDQPSARRKGPKSQELFAHI